MLYIIQRSITTQNFRATFSGTSVALSSQVSASAILLL
jgi:hypothetical protein